MFRNRFFRWKWITFVLLILVSSCAITKGGLKGKKYNPVQFGLLEAKNDVERFWVLYRCHSTAANKNRRVEYAGIDTITIEIPVDAKSIPLTQFTDFCGVTIVVRNYSKNFYLFNLSEKLSSIDIKPSEIDSRLYNNKYLRKGRHLLIIEDETPWVSNRKGFSYGAQRKDIVLVENNKGMNNPIMPYNNTISKPNVYICTPSANEIVFRNLTFVRTDDSRQKTYLVLFENLINVNVSNVKSFTNNKNNLYGDAIISVNNTYGLTFSDVLIDGTYSQQNNFGYGISLNNVYGLKANRLKAHANWGIFGNLNINNAILEDCDINRFDIHCYGRDVTMKNCLFSKLYNQFSSTYGTISFDNCVFTEFTPVLIENSYNAYTPFDVEWSNCIFNLDDRHISLIILSGLSQEINTRQELSRKCMPNVKLTNSTINAHGLKKWYILDTGVVKYDLDVDHISSISIDGLEVFGNSEMVPISQKVKTTKKVDVSVKRVTIKR